MARPLFFSLYGAYRLEIMSAYSEKKDFSITSHLSHHQTLVLNSWLTPLNINEMLIYRHQLYAWRNLPMVEQEIADCVDAVLILQQVKRFSRVVTNSLTILL